MKAKFTLTMIALCCMMSQLLAQKSPQIEGTWEMISQTGSNSDGSPIKTDVSKVKQYKIITPTHWMYIRKNIASDTINQGANYGEYTLTGNKYVEKLEGGTTNYTVKVEGDKFYMEGPLILDDGRKIFLNEVYQKVPGVVNTDKSLLGTWDLVSRYRMEGTNKVMDEATDKKNIRIITPTHFMYIEIKGQKLAYIALNSYTFANNKIFPKPILVTSAIDPNIKVELTDQLQGDKLMETVMITAPDGAKYEVGATFQKVKAKPAKVVSITK